MCVCLVGQREVLAIAACPPAESRVHGLTWVVGIPNVTLFLARFDDGVGELLVEAFAELEQRADRAVLLYVALRSNVMPRRAAVETYARKQKRRCVCMYAGGTRLGGRVGA